MDTIELGDIARDTVSGFEGVVIARTEWLYGCDRLTLSPRAMKDGKPIEGSTFDLPQLKLIKKHFAVPKRETGGPRPEPARGR